MNDLLQKKCLRMSRSFVTVELLIYRSNKIKPESKKSNAPNMPGSIDKASFQDSEAIPQNNKPSKPMKNQQCSMR